MSSVRRRLMDHDSNTPPPDPSPVEGEPVTLVPAAQLMKLKTKRSRRWQWSIFTFGSIFGVLLAAFFAKQHDVISLDGLTDFNMESLIDVIPVNILREAKDITVSLSHDDEHRSRSLDTLKTPPELI